MERIWKRLNKEDLQKDLVEETNCNVYFNSFGYTRAKENSEKNFSTVKPMIHGSTFVEQQML